MSAPLEFRPRFKFEISLSQEEITRRLQQKIDENNPEGIRVTKVSYHIILRPNPDNRHFWSPQLDINMEQLDEDHTLVRCLIGPMPAVWTMYVFLYGGLGLGALVSLMAGFSQWALNHTPWAFWFLPLCVAGLIMMILFAQFGQRLARNEMRMLKRFLDEALWHTSRKEIGVQR